MWRRIGSCHHQVLPLPAPEGHCLLSCTSGASPRFEASKFAHQPRRLIEAGRLWFGKGFWYPSEELYPWSCHTMVQSSRCTDGKSQVLHSSRHLVRRMYLCRNGEWKTSIPWWYWCQPVAKDLQDFRHSVSRDLAHDHWITRLEARLPSVWAPILGIYYTHLGSWRYGPHVQIPPVLARSKDIWQSSSRTWILQGTQWYGKEHEVRGFLAHLLFPTRSVMASHSC